MPEDTKYRDKAVDNMSYTSQYFEDPAQRCLEEEVQNDSELGYLSTLMICRLSSRMISCSLASQG